MSRRLVLVLTIWLLAIVAGARLRLHDTDSGRVAANSRGKTGYSGNPSINGGATCANCHYGGAEPTVLLDGPSTVDIGSTNMYTLTIRDGHLAPMDPES